jgi:hypothetical protein
MRDIFDPAFGDLVDALDLVWNGEEGSVARATTVLSLRHLPQSVRLDSGLQIRLAHRVHWLAAVPLLADEILRAATKMAAREAYRTAGCARRRR